MKTNPYIRFCCRLDEWKRKMKTCPYDSSIKSRSCSGNNGNLIFFDTVTKTSGDYGENHSVDDCDKCGKRVGAKNLKALPFLLLMRNDNVHPDVSYLIFKDNAGYRQYRVCDSCYKQEVHK